MKNGMRRKRGKTLTKNEHIGKFQGKWVFKKAKNAKWDEIQAKRVGHV
jgi:hypothetical protein